MCKISYCEVLGTAWINNLTNQDIFQKKTAEIQSSKIAGVNTRTLPAVLKKQDCDHERNIC